MSQIINEAETAFSRQAFDVRSHAIAVIQQADFIAQGLIGKTFGQLNATERKFFTDSRTLIANWERGNRNIAKDFESLAKTMEETVSRLPGGDKRPLVKNTVPSYISSGLIDDSVFVRVEGSRIGAGEPSLAFGQNTCKRIGKTERELKFECPAKVFTGFKKTTARSGKLLVVPPRSLLEVVLLQDAAPVSYDVGIIVVPPTLADTRQALRSSPKPRKNRKGASTSITRIHTASAPASTPSRSPRVPAGRLSRRAFKSGDRASPLPADVANPHRAVSRAQGSSFMGEQ